MAKSPIPKHWRKRAEEARAIAEELTDAKEREKMLKLGKDYDQLAERAEHRSSGRFSW